MKTEMKIITKEEGTELQRKRHITSYSSGRAEVAACGPDRCTVKTALRVFERKLAAK